MILTGSPPSHKLPSLFHAWSLLHYLREPDTYSLPSLSDRVGLVSLAPDTYSLLLHSIVLDGKGKYSSYSSCRVAHPKVYPFRTCRCIWHIAAGPYYFNSSKMFLNLDSNVQRTFGLVPLCRHLLPCLRLLLGHILQPCSSRSASPHGYFVARLCPCFFEALIVEIWTPSQAALLLGASIV